VVERNKVSAAGYLAVCARRVTSLSSRFPFIAFSSTLNFKCGCFLTEVSCVIQQENLIRDVFSSFQFTPLEKDIKAYTL